MCATLDEALEIATKNAKSGDSIVLSPATASYDQYESYVERGKHFDALVQKHIKNENKTKIFSDKRKQSTTSSPTLREILKVNNL